MGMRCEGDLERKKELETMERRSRRLQDLVEEWTNAIDAVNEGSSFEENSSPDFAKTLQMPLKKANRSH